jgi:hypothetical protein
MSIQQNERLTQLMTAALQRPEFGMRLLSQLPPAARAEALRRWSFPDSALIEAAPSRPGLRKCAAQPEVAKTGQCVQLEAFARTIRRVG